MREEDLRPPKELTHAPQHAKAELKFGPTYGFARGTPQAELKFGPTYGFGRGTPQAELKFALRTPSAAARHRPN